MENMEITYVIAWAALGAFFYFLDKKAQKVKTRKRLNIAGVISVFLLMFAVVYSQDDTDPKAIGAFMFLCMLFAIYITNKFTYYCSACNKRLNLLGKAVFYCPSCGGKLIK